MRKKSAVIFVSMVLNICFATFFILFFMQYQSQPKATIYMHQIGIFKENDNALQLTDDLSKLNIEAYSYKNDDLFVVVCNLSRTSEELKSKEALLADQNISYIEKEVSSSSAAFQKAIENQDFKQIMELMNN